jgi:hypothetical protein
MFGYSLQGRNAGSQWAITIAGGIGADVIK